jgi:hypothetical protein
MNIDLCRHIWGTKNTDTSICKQDMHNRKCLKFISINFLGPGIIPANEWLNEVFSRHYERYGWELIFFASEVLR